MHPSEVRDSVLHDHGALRVSLDRLEALARAVGGGSSDHVDELRRSGRALLASLETHMHWEDLHLGPALREADAWGEEREARLREDHREQREVLALALDALRDAERPAVLVARGLLDLIVLLREDMEDEERSLLDPNVLRDDVVSIDLEAG